MVLPYGSSLCRVFADSPILDHESIPNNTSNWTLVPLVALHNSTIRDGRTFYFETATDRDRSQCDIMSPFLPKLKSVTYISNGKTLNTTFWLSRPPLNGTFLEYPFVNATQIHQRFLKVTVFPSENMTLNELIKHENSSLMKENFTNLKIVNVTHMLLGKSPSYKLQITGKFKPFFGEFNANATEILTIKGDNVYRLLYIYEPIDYSNLLSTIQHTISLFRLMDDKINKTSIYSTIRPEGWLNVTTSNNKTSSILFFSPISGAYLLHGQYVLSIAEPSYYNETTDFQNRLVWDDSKYHVWTKQVEEASPDGQSRIIDSTDKYKPYIREAQNYVLLPLDLHLINSPSQYIMVFTTNVGFIKGGRLCELADLSTQVSNPPPKISIIPSVNSSTIGPGQIKSIEVKVTSSSRIPTNISSISVDTKDLPIVATLNPNRIIVPPSGWVTTELTLKGNDSLTNPISHTVTETLPIIAKITFPKLVKYSLGNVTVPVPGPPLSKPQNSSLTVTMFSPNDYLFNIWNSLNTPLNGAATFIAAIIGILGFLIYRKTR